MATRKGKEILRALAWRYATKKFDPHRKVDDADIEVLMESLRLAPSSMGVQPWKFMLVRDPAVKKKLVSACFGQKQVQEASHVIVTCAYSRLSPEFLSGFMDSLSDANPEKSIAGKIAQKARLAAYRKVIEGYVFAMGREKTAEWNKKQAYIALGFLLSACAHLGIDSCPIEGYNKGQAEKILGLDSMGLEIVTMVPIGFRSKNDKHASENKARFAKKDVAVEI
jgi:nitroreductase / dihydropteridine reductase